MQGSGSENHTDHTLCIKISHASWSEQPKTEQKFIHSCISAETRSAFWATNSSKLGGWLGNETDGRHRLLTLACSCSRSWFLIKLIIYQKSPSCFLEGVGDKLCSLGCFTNWPHGKMAPWSVVKWQNIRGLFANAALTEHVLAYFAAQDGWLLMKCLFVWLYFSMQCPCYLPL